MKKAFTLIELLVVIAIIATIGSIIVSMIVSVNQRVDAQQAAAIAKTAEVSKGVTQAYVIDVAQNQTTKRWTISCVQYHRQDTINFVLPDSKKELVDQCRQALTHINHVYELHYQLSNGTAEITNVYE